jgi:hypothetical protein
MKQIDVLIIVDTLGAVTSGNLGQNTYMVDTNKHFGSGNEGQDELKTACENGQIINWRITSVSPSNDIEITGFTGQMVKSRICLPEKQGIGEDVYWAAEVQTQGQTGTWQYSVNVTINGKSMTFDPFLIVK